MTEQEYAELETQVTNGQLLITHLAGKSDDEALEDKERRVVMYAVGEHELTPPDDDDGEPQTADAFCLRIGAKVPVGTQLMIRLKREGLELLDMTVGDHQAVTL